MTSERVAWPDEVLAAIDAVEDKYDIVLVSGPHHQEWVERSEAQAKEIERLQRNLRVRDDFIVGKDLWGEFTDSLRPADA